MNTMLSCEWMLFLLVAFKYRSPNPVDEWNKAFCYTGITLVWEKGMRQKMSVMLLFSLHVFIWARMHLHVIKSFNRLRLSLIKREIHHVLLI